MHKTQRTRKCNEEQMPHLIANKPGIKQLRHKEIVYQTACPLVPITCHDVVGLEPQSFVHCVALTYKVEVESDIIYRRDTTNNLRDNTECNSSTCLAAPESG